MNDKDIEAELTAMESKLMDPVARVQVLLTSVWARSAPTTPGVYAWFDGDKLIYVGESSSLSERMGDSRRTVNHTLRRSIGADKHAAHPEFQPATSRRKFAQAIEQELDVYMRTLKVAFLPVKFGRTELEEYMIKCHKPRYNTKKRRGS